MSTNHDCPNCTMTEILDAGTRYECVVCGHEWMKDSVSEGDEVARVVKDANGNTLSNGDAVTLIKALKLKGSSSSLKVGTKVKGIRIVDGDHEVECKIDGTSIMLKACFLKKV